MSTDLLALLDRDPAAGILAAADLREQRAKATDDDMPGPWWVERDGLGGGWGPIPGGKASLPVYGPHIQHIVAEANPPHARAAVRRWRGVVERHAMRLAFPLHGQTGRWEACRRCGVPYPCPDLTETADEVRAYVLGGAA